MDDAAGFGPAPPGGHLQHSLAIARVELTPQLTRAAGAIDEAIISIRASIFDLQAQQPGGGLNTRLRRVVEDMEPMLGLRPEFRIDGPVEDIDASLAHDLVACLREALSDVVRHAQATEISATVDATEDHVAVQVIDNGVGCTAALRASRVGRLVARGELRPRDGYSSKAFVDPTPRRAGLEMEFRRCIPTWTG